MTDSSPCPRCDRPVGHHLGRVRGSGATFSAAGGNLPDNPIREADCPHCDMPMMRGERGQGGWEKDYGRAPRGEKLPPPE
jgi:hypothetical protein